MTLFRMMMVLVAILVASSGCYYDQWQASQRALRTNQQALSQAQSDLLDCEHMNKQKDTQIEALQNQNDTLNRTVANLEAQAAGLKDALAQAQRIAETMAGKQVGPVTIINRQLPPEVDEALTRLVEQYPHLLEKVGNSIRWKSDLLFELGKAEVSVSNEVREALRRFAEIVQSPAASGLELIIVGHTDTTPIRRAETLREHKTNWGLSAHRAIAVMQVLHNLGLSESRMGIMGYGEHRPIADNTTESGKARNRRVEIYLVPKGSITGTGNPGVYNSEAGPFVRPNEVGAATPPAGRSAPQPEEAPAGTPFEVDEAPAEQ